MMVTVLEPPAESLKDLTENNMIHASGSYANMMIQLPINFLKNR